VSECVSVACESDHGDEECVRVRDECTVCVCVCVVRVW
jgi:hypothetical protein